MSNSTQQQSEASRVQVGNLPQQEKDLTEKEADKVKGGRGPSGGVNRQAGEEIPQTIRK